MVQIYSGVVIDDDTDISDLSDQELEQNSIARNQVRVAYPGLTAFHFECVLDIIIEEVIRWDPTCNKPKEGDMNFLLGG